MIKHWDKYNLYLEIGNYNKAKVCLNQCIVLYCIEMEYKIDEF